MKIPALASVMALAAVLLSGIGLSAAERSVASSDSQASRAQQLLDKAAGDEKYAFLVFIKNDDVASQTMFQTVKAELAKQPGKALLGAVSVTSASEQAIVKRFDVSRAPMPFLLVVAPNGAITGTFGKKITPPQISACFVTPTMAVCMKSLQQGKSVLVCVHSTPTVKFPAGVLELQRDPEFKDRFAVTSLNATDPDEAPFLEQTEMTPAELKGTTTVFLAPPGALVGKFAASTSKDDFLAALHSAGQCCNDENCKHNHAKKGAAANQGAAAAQQPSARQAKQNGKATRN